MNLRLQARIAIALVGMLILGGLLIQVQTRLAFNLDSSESEELDTELHRIADALYHTPIEDRRARLSELSSHIEAPLSLEPRRLEERPRGPRRPRRHEARVDAYTILVARPERPRASREQLFFWSSFIALIVVVAGVTLLVGRPLSRRLVRLEHAARALRNGSFELNLKPGISDEIGDLERVLHDAAHHLERRFAERQELLQAVAHELNTPLARMQFLVARIQSAELRAQIMTELEELGKLSGELSEWVDADDAPIHRRRFRVDELIEVLTNLERDRAAETHGADVDVRLELEEFDVEGDLRQLERAIENIVRNALRFARHRVVIRATRVDSDAIIHVEDDGPGIPEDQRARVVKPFVSLEASRSREVGTGMGLGMAITARTLTRHEGHMELGTSTLGGALVTMSLPRAHALQPGATFEQQCEVLP